MNRYHVVNIDAATMGGAARVRCQCGHDVFSTPEPVTDRFYSGRFVCTACGHVWNAANIAQRIGFLPVTRSAGCACATNTDGTTTTTLCPVHADTDPCLTMATVTGKRRKGTVRRGVCTACGHRDAR